MSSTTTSAAPEPELHISQTPVVNSPRTPLVVFCAGSLILPFADLETAFEALHPNVDVLNECHGSIQVIRHVTELHEKIDVVATADRALIPLLMYSAQDSESGLPYANWYVHFAGNRLALAHSGDSRYAAEITGENWFEVISRPDVRVGLADPRFDAAGYRALMALKLAENSTGRKTIFKDLLQDQFRYPITAFSEEGFAEIHVPEIVEPLAGSHIIVRGASIQLIALLESGDLDYAFEYESVIRQHSLEVTSLPEAVNLGASGAASDYAKVSVILDFQRFQSVKPVFRGEPIGYAITIPTNAPQPLAAAEYIAFLIGPAGQSILAKNAQPSIIPPECDGQASMPPLLAALCPPAP